MSGRGRRWTAERRRRLALIAVPAVVVVAVGVGAIAAAAPNARSAPAPTTTSASAVQPSPSVSPTRSAAPRKAPAGPPTAVPGGVPQPTRTASISGPATIVTALTVRVIKMEAVMGQADGPGEIAGPAVRFTITISNRTGRTVNLSDTVVNAYAGADGAPALPLRMPGGLPFPASVPAGRSATGVFVFTVPVASRSLVEVTVDTSVHNPIVAFRGAAPK